MHLEKKFLEEKLPNFAGGGTVKHGGKSVLVRD